jgi:hypothetical protein
MGASDGHDREIFSPSLVRRRGGIAIPHLDENPSAGWDQPNVELVPELYTEVRRLAAALTTAPAGARHPRASPPALRPGNRRDKSRTVLLSNRPLPNWAKSRRIATLVSTSVP